MDTETLWILRKLTAGEISAQSADRILQALALLRKSEEDESMGDPAVAKQEAPDEISLAPQQNIPPEKEQAAERKIEDEQDDDESLEMQAQEVNANRENILWPESANERPLLESDGVGIIEDIPDGIELLLENAGNVTIQGWSQNHIRAEGKVDSSTVLRTEKSLKIGSKNGIVLYVPPAVTEINIASGSGSIALTDIGGDIDIETNSGNIMLERCRGEYISVESNGGEITFRDIADDISIKSKDGSISVDNFSGAVSVESKNSEVSLRNGGDAEIHIESDGGNISIEDCYAHVYVNSGVGNVFVSGENFSFGGMGKIELRMKTGNAYLHRRTFENIRIAIEEGNAEVNMEKLNSGGSGQISVYRGNVTVGVLPSFGCELTAHGPRKKMRIELPVEIIEKDKSRLRGILNGGGAKMEVIAPNGEIRFHALESSYIQSDIGNATNNQ